MKTRAITLSAMGALALALAIGAKADTQTYMAMTPDLFTAGSRTELVASPISIPLFDPSMGTLTGVCVSEEVLFDSAGNLSNHATQKQNVKFTVDTFTTLSGPNGISLTLDPSATTGVVSLDPGTDTPYHLTGDATDGPNAYSDAGTLGAFTGVGNATFLADTLTGLSLSGGGGNVTFTQDTFAKAIITVQYKFEPPKVTVPEPGTIAMGVSMMLAGGVLVRRRKK